MEVEAIANSRPLTYLHEKNMDVLRTIDFLMPAGNIRFPSLKTDKNEGEEQHPSKRNSKEVTMETWKGYFSKSIDSGPFGKGNTY